MCFAIWVRIGSDLAEFLHVTSPNRPTDSSLRKRINEDGEEMMYTAFYFSGIKAPPRIIRGRNKEK